MKNCVIVNSLYKSYGTQKALKGISFDVDKSELFGFIGPDGAGKTSLFRIIATLLYPDSGEVFIDGINVVNYFRKIRNILGYMPGRFSLYQDLSVEQNLNFYAKIFGTDIHTHYYLISEIYKYLEPFKNRLAGKLSGGMKQKLALCCSLIHKPEIIILDEPTTGVDAVSRKEFWDILGKLKNEGITIIVSTPYMDEAALCDRVALIQEGNILSIEKPEIIIKSFNKKLLALSSADIYKLIRDLRDYSGKSIVNLFGHKIHMIMEDDESKIRELHAFIEAKGHCNISIEVVEPGIEDCFIDLMQ